MDNGQTSSSESEKWRRALIDAALDAIVVIDADGIILDFNHAAEELFGFQKATVVGKKMVNLIVPLGMRESHNQGMLRLKQSGIGRILGERLEVSARRSDGTEFQVELVVNKVDLSDQPVYVGTIRDVSDQKQAEESLRSSELRFRSLADSAPVMIWLAGFDGAISWFNEVWLNFTGRAIEDALGFGWTKSVHPDDLEDLLREYHATLDSRTSMSTEFRLRKNNGDYHWVLVNIAPTYSPDGLLVGYAGSLVDIHTRYLAQEALQLTRFALDRAGDGVFLINRDSSLDYVNDSACLMLGYSRKELLKLGVCDFSADLTTAQWDEHWGKLKKLKQSTIDTFHIRKDGTQYPVEIHLNFIEFQGRELNCAVARDVSEKHHAKQVITNALHDAQAANQAKSEFLAIVSHEMRTPLNGLLGMIELLHNSPLKDDQYEMLDVCNQSGKHLKNLIDDVLDFSLIQQGRFELHVEILDLRTLLNQLRDSIKEQVREKGIELRWAVDTEVPKKIAGDASRLYQILENILSNAIKFTDQGFVSFAVSVVASNAGEAILQFSIEDSGIGIQAKDRERIFRKFEQVDASTTRSHRGIGLGLAICRELANQMNGQIRVDVGTQGGSLFCFTAPFSLDGTELTKPVFSESVHPWKKNDLLAGLNVMLVEDDAASRMVAKRILEQAGIAVTTAQDGLDAVEQYEKTPISFDVIFMDITMPRLDGMSAMSRIRELGGAGGCPIIAMTALAMEGDRERLLEAGFDEYIAKPIRQAVVFETLCNMFSSGHAKKTVDRVEPMEFQVVDLAKLRKHCGFDRELLTEIVQRFGETCDDSVKRIHDGLAENNLNKVVDAAHRLKGSLGSICAISAFELANHFEIAARESKQENLDADFPALISAIDELRNILNEQFG